MRMSNTKLFDEFLKDNYKPAEEDQGAHIAEVIENQLTQRLREFETKLDDKLNQINQINQTQKEEIQDTPDNEDPAPEEQPEGGDVESA